MLESAPKLGFEYRALVVPSNEVDLNGAVYQKFKQLQRYWEVKDHYSNPGPSQFYDEDHKNDISETLNLLFSSRAADARQIQAICNSIVQNSLFIENDNLLKVALASLLSAKQVINQLQN